MMFCVYGKFVIPVIGTSDQLVSKESAQEGSVTWRTYHQYCTAAGGTNPDRLVHTEAWLSHLVFQYSSPVLAGYIIVLITFIIFLLLVGTTAFSSWWLSYWLEQGSGVISLVEKFH